VLKPVIQNCLAEECRRVVRGGAARQLRLLGNGQGPGRHRDEKADRALGQ
jgi:hypothetical protein